MPTPILSRRRLLQSAGALAAVAYTGLPSCTMGIAPRFTRNPFTLGVASGEPAPDGMVLWTRLAPDPVNAEATGPEAVPVTWEVAEDEGFRTIVQRGSEMATAQWAHSVHAEVAGLRPDRWYWYRFHAAGITSPEGRTRTLPAAGAPVARWRLALASCQNYQHGYYTAYPHMLKDDVDLVVFVGDYIYEYTSSASAIRNHRGPETRTLAQYRDRYAQYREDPNLQAMHAACPWVVTWDDHEVQNDYANLHPQDGMPTDVFRARRAAAYQAYYEHMPLRRSARPTGADMPLYRSFAIGDLMSVHMLDERQYRDDQACPTPGKLGGQAIFRCAERVDPARSLLGKAQEDWLHNGLGAAKTRWTVLAQQMLMAQLRSPKDRGYAHWSDGWDGYPATRTRLLKAIYEKQVPNVVSLGGDIHSYWVSDLKLDFDREDSPIVGTDFTGTSISSRSSNHDAFASWLPANPHIKFMESRQRGYLRAEITPRAWRSDLVTVDSVALQESPARTLASFVVESGRPGVQRA